MPEKLDLESWIAEQARYSAAAMERAISATRLRRRRDAFRQTVMPAKGSVLASPVIADWNPEPDYFFHWLRDSAIVMRAVADLMADAPAKAERRRWRRHFEDFVGFSFALSDNDGAAYLAHARFRQATRAGLRKFLRTDAEIRKLTGERLLGEPRFNPDGTIDIFRWSRPQYDGPALRALACLRYLAAGGLPNDAIARLLHLDLAFTVRHAGQHCIGPWEEPGQNAHHYYVGVVQLGALVHGRAWADDADARDKAEARLRAKLDRHWSKRHEVYSAMRPAKKRRAEDLIDAAQLVAVLDADLADGPHSVFDPRIRQTWTAIDALFAREFPINSGRDAPALGRYRGDRYFGGGAWYPTTLAAAGLCYRLARLAGRDRAHWMKRGDNVMVTVRDLVPADGALSEQVDRSTGAQTSARHLAWSYAAFLTAARLRAHARNALRSR